MSVLTRVDTGTKSEYIFRTLHHASGNVEVLCGPRGVDDRDANFYHEFDGKGTTAVRRLVESHAELRRFFDAARGLAEFDPHGRFVRFIEAHECDTDELEAHRDTVAEIFEAVADVEGWQQ